MIWKHALRGYEKIKMVKILFIIIKKEVENCEAKRPSTHHLHIHIDCSRNVLLIITKTKNFIFYSKCFTLSNNLNQDQISPFLIMRT